MKYNSNNETTNRYLAGLVDGDGCITVAISKDICGHYKPMLRFTLGQHIGDRYPKAQETMEWLYDHYGFGTMKMIEGSKMLTWTASGKKAESLVNRFKKHLVIKGQHADRMIELWKEYSGYGNYIDTLEKAQDVRDQVRLSRDNTGPIKPKNHTSLPWLAGYTDSDGSILVDNSRGNRGCVSYHCHKRDHAALELIAHSYGRSLEYPDSKPDTIRLRFNIGPQSFATAKRLLCPMVKHLRIRKWNAEQLLHVITQPAKTE